MKPLIYPGKDFRYEVMAYFENDDGDVQPAESPEDAQFWAVYSRPQPEGLAMWVGEFQSETDAREYAAWRAHRS